MLVQNNTTFFKMPFKKNVFRILAQIFSPNLERMENFDYIVLLWTAITDKKLKGTC